MCEICFFHFGDALAPERLARVSVAIGGDKQGRYGGCQKGWENERLGHTESSAVLGWMGGQP